MAKIGKFLRNILDDVAVLLSTVGGVLLSSYIRPLLAVMEGALWEKQMWPRWYVLVPALAIAIIVVCADAQKGDPEGRKRNMGPRAMGYFLQGLGWRALMGIMLGG